MMTTATTNRADPTSAPPVFEEHELFVQTEETTAKINNEVQRQRELVEAINRDSVTPSQRVEIDRVGLLTTYFTVDKGGRVHSTTLRTPNDWNGKNYTQIFCAPDKTSDKTSECLNVLQRQIDQLESWQRSSKMTDGDCKIHKAVRLRLLQLRYLAGDAKITAKAFCVSVGQEFELLDDLMSSGDPVDTFRTVVDVIDVPVNNFVIYGIYGETLVLRACRCGRLDILKFLVDEKGCSVLTLGDAEVSPMHCAALAGSLPIVNYLIQCGARLDVRCKDSLTPLHLAASKGLLDIVKRLVERGAGMDTQDTDGNTTIHMTRKHPRIVQFLVTKGADIGKRDKYGVPAFWCSLVSAAYGDDLQYYKEHFQRCRREFETSPEFATIILRVACAEFSRTDFSAPVSLKILQYLIEEENANPYDGLLSGNTLLHHASGAGCLPEAQYWVDHCGMSLEAVNDDGMTPVHVAAKNGHLETVQWLAKRGSLLSQRDNSNKTTLHWAFHSGNTVLVNWCVAEQGMDYRQRDNNGLSALDVGIEQGHWDFAKWYFFSLHGLNAPPSPDLRRPDLSNKGS